MVLKKSKIKIPCIRLNFRIVRQSDARWCERKGVNHALLLDLMGSFLVTENCLIYNGKIIATD